MRKKQYCSERDESKSLLSIVQISLMGFFALFIWPRTADQRSQFAQRWCDVVSVHLGQTGLRWAKELATRRASHALERHFHPSKPGQQDSSLRSPPCGTARLHT